MGGLPQVTKHRTAGGLWPTALITVLQRWARPQSVQTSRASKTNVNCYSGALAQWRATPQVMRLIDAELVQTG